MSRKRYIGFPLQFVDYRKLLLLVSLAVSASALLLTWRPKSQMVVIVKCEKIIESKMMMDEAYAAKSSVAVDIVIDRMVHKADAAFAAEDYLSALQGYREALRLITDYVKVEENRSMAMRKQLVNAKAELANLAAALKGE